MLELKRRAAKLKTSIKSKWAAKNKKKLGLQTGGVLLLGAAIAFFALNPNTLSKKASAKIPMELGAFERVDVKQKYGLVFNEYSVTEGVVKQNEYLGIILDRHQITGAEIDQVAQLEKTKEGWPTFRTGRNYTVLSNKETGKAEYFIYDPSPYEYFVYKLEGGMEITSHEREVTQRVSTSSGVVSSSLWNAIVDSETIDESMVNFIAAKMEEAFQWSVSFHHLQKGDRFKLIFEEDIIEGQSVGVGKLLAAEFSCDDKTYHAIRYKSDNYDGYFDLEARPMVKTFLRAPVKYSRISSRYNKRRFHPVLKRTKAHLGTDFAAPRGTPIYATANGTIIKKGRTRGNGNYIKIKHDKTYSTQYLHMHGFAKGMATGVRVTQGDVIGYVGSTGLATGPHVCYRFWKNGAQVDPLRLNFPPPEPMKDADKEKFLVEKDDWQSKLEAIPYIGFEEEKAEIAEEAEVEPEKSNP